MPTGQVSIECRSLSKSYQTWNGILYALEDITFSLGDYEFLSIVGPSGCGKTTLLKMIAGVLKPTSGEIIFPAELIDGRTRTALVFQEHGLFPWMNVLDNVAFGLAMQGISRNERYSRALSFIDKVGLGPFAKSYPHELSVGMSQRVGIARCFVSEPKVMLMDEPLSALDAQTRLVLQEELIKLWRDSQKSVLYVTHDIEEAVWLGDQVLVMTGRPGRVREIIPIPLDHPRDLSTSDRSDAVEIKQHIWKLLEEEVRNSLWISS